MAASNMTASRPLEPKKRAIIIGASSGIGAALLHRLALQGYQIAALARRQEELEGICDSVNRNFPQANGDRALAYIHDVTNYEEIPSLFQNIVADLGGLDLIIYAAAIQYPVNLSEFDFNKDLAMIEVNLLGAMAWLNEAALRFERGRKGHIVGISSIAGARGRVGGPAYNSSKAALNTYLEALRNRLAKRGVTVTTIIPGFVDTRLLKNAPRTFWVISPEDAAAQIFLAIKEKKQTSYIPRRWGLVGLIIKHIPSFVFRRLSF